MSPVSVLHNLIGTMPTFWVTVGLFLLAAVVIYLDRSWSSWLFFIGAGGALIGIAFDLFCGIAFERGWLQRAGLLEGDALSPVVDIPFRLIELLSLCIPVALLLYCVRAVRLGLTSR